MPMGHSREILTTETAMIPKQNERPLTRGVWKDRAFFPPDMYWQDDSTCSPVCKHTGATTRQPK